MTDAIETISLTEGMPLGAHPSSVVHAARIRYEWNRQDKIDISLATANLILGGFSGSSDNLSAVAHMFTEDELNQIREEREERQQLALQVAQLAKLRKIYNGAGRGSNISKDRGPRGSGRT